MKVVPIATPLPGERVVANTAEDEAVLQQLIAQDPIGHTGNVRVQDGINFLEL